MLRTLSIRDFVIVDALELEFAQGFTVLTGETGAGKSILIDALMLALGGRADLESIRAGAPKTDITAEFSIDAELAQWLEDHALSAEEGHLLLRRVIDIQGRSKAFINGVAVTVAQLRAVGDQLIDIHGQHAHHSLLRADVQRQLLDEHAHLQALAQTVAAAYRAWRNACAARAQHEQQSQNLQLQREQLEWQVQALQKIAPQPDEWQQITAEHHRLAHAANLLEGAQTAHDLLSGSDHTSAALLSTLNGVLQKIRKLAEIDPRLAAVLQMLEPAQIQVQEAAYELQDYVSRLQIDPARLEWLEARLEELHSAARKFKIAPEELSAEYQRLTQQLEQLTHASDSAALLAQEQTAHAHYLHVAQQLSNARRDAAGALRNAITAAMQELNMRGGQFDVALTPVEPTSHGLEDIEFLVAGHAGVAPKPLSKVASGGELARIALAISVITSSATKTPTLIFDEVDSGIGGATAEVVGRLLKQLGQERQVLCVTHLAQVASQAQTHFQVSKQTKQTIAKKGKTAQTMQTISHIQILNPAERIEEIARMLGGQTITATTRQHAQELLTAP